jgi:hypothetical protein
VVVIWIESDGTVVSKIGFRNMDSMQFSDDYFSHLTIPLNFARISGAGDFLISLTWFRARCASLKDVADWL